VVLYVTVYAVDAIPPVIVVNVTESIPSFAARASVSVKVPVPVAPVVTVA